MDGELIWYLFILVFCAAAITLPIIFFIMRLRAGRKMKKTLLQLEECVAILKTREMEVRAAEERLRSVVDNVYPDRREIAFCADSLAQAEKDYVRQYEEYYDMNCQAQENLGSLCLTQNLCGGACGFIAIGYHMKHAKLLKITRNIRCFKIDEGLILRARKALESA